MKPIAPHIQQLDEIAANLGDIKITASKFRKTVGDKYSYDECRSALRKAGKLQLVGKIKTSYPELNEYVKNSPTKLTTSHICQKFNVKFSTAFFILRNHNMLENRKSTMRRKDKSEILALAKGKPITASKLQTLAAAKGINISRSYCRSILESAKLLEQKNRGRSYKHPHVYEYVRNNPPMRIIDLARKFDISPKTARNILYLCAKKETIKTPEDCAKELPAPITAQEFAKLNNCAINTAYVMLKRAKKLKIIGSGRKATRPIREQTPPQPKPQKATPPPREIKVIVPAKPVIEPPPPPPKPRPQTDTRAIASIFAAWKEKNL